jgi:hypothetical protein
MMVATGALVAASSVGIFVASATADPPAGSVNAHRHYVVKQGNLVEVGPNSCEDGKSLQFDNFHNNVHRGVPGVENGVVESRPCSFQP